MSNHTPGPWRKYRATETRIAITCGEPHAPEYDGFDVCSIRIVPSKGKECHANVDLLIAAPDLLESLRMAVKYLRGENMGSVMLPKFEAAIAKAEGR